MAETKLKPEQAIATRFKLGTFTRDQTATGADVAYTGVGFKPKIIQFFLKPVAVDGSNYQSIGFDDGTTHFCTLMKTSSNSLSTTSSIFAGNGSSWDHYAIVKTMDSDGFTLTWTKTGTPGAGTLNIYYVAFR